MSTAASTRWVSDTAAVLGSDPPIDALLLLSFGGPHGPADVLPFLRNVTAGRNVPDERLAVVAEHYRYFGGVSPITTQNLELIEALRVELAARGSSLPIYFGNRNWTPYVSDAVAEMARDGVRHAAVLATSATASYSACRQYRQDMAGASHTAAQAGLQPPMLTKLRHYFDLPGFVAAHADGVRTALARLGTEASRARLVFTAHAIPVSMNFSSGPSGGLYLAQQQATARLVAEAVRGAGAEFDLVWQSRSGPPSVPWLEPDINDHLRDLAAGGVTSVVVAPSGFVSDHLEVAWDLDVEARRTADELGLRMERAAAAGTHPAFVAGLVDLVEELTTGRTPEQLSELGLCGLDCPADCCAPPVRPGRSA